MCNEISKKLAQVNAQQAEVIKELTDCCASLKEQLEEKEVLIDWLVNALEKQTEESNRFIEELKLKNQENIDLLESFVNYKVALDIMKAHKNPNSTVWLTARQLSPKGITQGEASAFGKRLTDVYRFVTEAAPKQDYSVNVYPVCMQDLWSTFQKKNVG